MEHPFVALTAPAQKLTIDMAKETKQEKTERDIRFEKFLELLKEQSPRVYKEYEDAKKLDQLKAEFQ